MTENTQALAPVLYIPHGGGPLPLLGDKAHEGLTRFLSTIASRLDNVRAILVISAHWEEAVPTVCTHEAPGMYFDYYNFPTESYEYSYPAPGEPALANHILEMLKKAGIKQGVESERGFDHGAFVPLMLMYPKADVPVVQLSLASHLDPEFHIKLGEAISGLREQGVLILGSGLSFHNLNTNPPASVPAAAAFNKWLKEVCSSKRMDPKQRYLRLSQWEEAPHGRYCHPREEHLIPLHVCVGAALGKPAEIAFDEPLWEHEVSAYLWR